MVRRWRGILPDIAIELMNTRWVLAKLLMAWHWHQRLERRGLQDAAGHLRGAGATDQRQPAGIIFWRWRARCPG